MRRTALVVLALIALAALLAPWLAPFNPVEQLDIAALKNVGPSMAHPLGTDPYSRDVLSRLLFGARTSLFIGVFATVLATLVGCLWGGVAAMAGARTGGCLMLIVDILRSVPRLLLFLVVVALMGVLSPVLLAIVLAAAAWPVIARLVYTLARDAHQREWVEAARAVGANRWNVLVHHVAPHLAGSIGAAATLLFADLIAVESGLSFLGIGIRAPAPSWGNMVQDALPYLGSAWWVAAVPCVCLLATVLAVGSIANGQAEARKRPVPPVTPT